MGWKRLKEAIKTGAEEVFGFQKANHAQRNHGSWRKRLKR